MVSIRWICDEESSQLFVSTTDGRLIIYDYEKEKIVSIIDTDQKKSIIDFTYLLMKKSPRIICLFDDGVIGTYLTRKEKFNEIFPTEEMKKKFKRIEQIEKNRLLLSSDGVSEYNLKSGEIVSTISRHSNEIKEFEHIWNTDKYFTVSDFDNFIPIYQNDDNSISEWSTLQSMDNIHLKWCDMIIDDILIVHSSCSVFLFESKKKRKLFPFRQIKISVKNEKMEISFVDVSADKEQLQIFYKNERDQLTQQSISFQSLIDKNRTKELTSSNISVTHSKKNLMVIQIVVNETNKCKEENNEINTSNIESYTKNVNSTNIHPIVTPQIETISCDSGRGCSVTPDIAHINDNTSLAEMKDSMTMYQRIELLKKREHRKNTKEINIDTNSIAGLLTRALVDTNGQLMNQILSQRNKIILRKTLEEIDVETSVKFLDVLCRLLRTSTQEKELSIIRWLNHLLMINGRHIRNASSARHLLEDARGLLKKRTSLHSAIAQLQGRFLLFTQQQQQQEASKKKKNPEEEAFVLQYVDDDNEDGIDDDLEKFDLIENKSDDDNDDENLMENITPENTDDEQEEKDVEMEEKMLEEIVESSGKKLKFIKEDESEEEGEIIRKRE
ncbi:hypothetical protein SNEBB_002336, partial [Seison nebaliae]